MVVPLVTLLMVTYNQQDYVVDALRGALDQDYANLQIIVSDDSSTDSTYAQLSHEISAYQGPHSLRLRQTDRNRGLTGHLNEVAPLASGNLVVIAAGDDISRPQRVRKLAEAHEALGRAKYVCLGSAADVIDESGLMVGPYNVNPPSGHLSLERAAYGLSGILGCTAAWTPDVFVDFGPIDAAATREDSIIPFRAALAGTTLILQDALVLYRLHKTNLQYKEVQAVRNKSEMYADQTRHARGNIFVAVQMRLDVETARGKGLLDPTQAAQLTTMLIESEGAARIEARLAAANGDRRVLIRLLPRALVSRVRPRRKIRWILTYAMPRTYLYYRTVQRRKQLR